MDTLPPHMTRLLGQMESDMKAIHTLMTDVRCTMGHLEGRLRRIEHQVMFWKGGMGVLLIISSLIGMLVPFLK